MPRTLMSFGRKKEDARHEVVCRFFFGKRGGSAPIDLSSTCFVFVKKEVTDRKEKEWAVRGVFMCEARAEARTKRYGIWHRCPWDDQNSRRKSMYSTTSTENPPFGLSSSVPQPNQPQNPIPKLNLPTSQLNSYSEHPTPSPSVYPHPSPPLAHPHSPPSLPP